MRWLRYSLALLFGALGTYFSYIAHDRFYGALDPAQTYNLMLPASADVRPQDAVKPGTFTVQVSTEDFRDLAKRADQRMLATYGVPFEESESEELILKYWLPRTDVVGTFYYAEEHVRMPFLHRASVIRSIHTANGILTVDTKRTGWGMGWSLGALCLFVLVGVCFHPTRKLMKRVNQWLDTM